MMFLADDGGGFFVRADALRHPAEALPRDAVDGLRHPARDVAALGEHPAEDFGHPDADVSLFEHREPEVPVLEALQGFVETRKTLAADERTGLHVIMLLQALRVERPEAEELPAEAEGGVRVGRFRMLGERGGELLERVRAPDDVGVAEEHERSGAFAETSVAGRRPSPVFLADETDTAMIRRERAAKVVRRTVVDDDDLHVGVRLRQEAFQRPADRGGVVVARDDDGDPAHASRFRNSDARRSQVKSRVTRARPASPRRLASSASFRRRLRASNSSPSESGSTRSPVAPSSTASGTPPARVETTGSPKSAASRKTMPKPSTSSFFSRTARAKTSAAR